MIMTGFAPLNTEQCILHESRIDLWQFSLKNELYIADQLLNSEEQARAQRFHFSKHRRRFTNARATLRIILGRYLNCARNVWNFPIIITVNLLLKMRKKYNLT